MTDRAIREAIVRLLLKSDDVFSVSDISDKLQVSEVDAESNMTYLVDKNYAVPYYGFSSRDFWIARGRSSASYLAVPDSTVKKTTINVSGNSNIVAGHDMQVSNSNFSNVYGVPQELEHELNNLLDEIRYASSPKSEQVSKTKAFFDKVATSCTSSAVASCATAIFKAAIGLP